MFTRILIQVYSIHCSLTVKGNVLVRKVNGKPQIVVLDHGLYIDESNLFRRQYSEFWRAMMTQNKEKLMEICHQWVTNNDLYLIE